MCNWQGSPKCAGNVGSNSSVEVSQGRDCDCLLIVRLPKCQSPALWMQLWVPNASLQLQLLGSTAVSNR